MFLYETKHELNEVVSILPLNIHGTIVSINISSGENGSHIRYEVRYYNKNSCDLKSDWFIFSDIEKVENTSKLDQGLI